MENFVIRKNWVNRWIIVHPLDSLFAWSGLRWVGIDQDGTPYSIPICNFATASEAASVAEETVSPAPAEGPKSELSSE
jgi:hypothetical protein